MAISKERLEQLIKQKAIVYTLNYDLGSKYLYALHLQKGDVVSDTTLFSSNRPTSCLYTGIGIGNIFETKEEAEWDLEFGDTTMMIAKTLHIPTWDEINEQLNDSGSYERDGYLYELHNNVLSVYQTFCMEYNKIYEGTFTKEHYIEACRICKKLSLGEDL